ncbi:hypothetical protein QQ054_25255 [Oscillatoria amoena NRMC-F 0135]|nr:hypothetical protein [Oscillatoria amoena NRMC-F 0135]
MKRNGSPIKLFVFILLSVLLITFSFYAYQICYTPNILVGKEDRYLYIPQEATFETVQKTLHEGGYVQDLMSFSFLSRLLDYDKLVKPGRFFAAGQHEQPAGDPVSSGGCTGAGTHYLQ